MKKKDLEKRIERLEERLHTQDDPKEVDFSILNEDDVFYVETKTDKWLAMGSIIEWGKHKHYCITSERKYSGESGVLTSKKGNIKERRLATPDEKELFYKHFPKKRKVWIEVWENEDGYIWADAFDKETELKESQKYNKASGFKSLEVIEREY